MHPHDDSDLIFHSDGHASGLFGFDKEKIFHKSDKFWHAENGSPYPRNDVKVVSLVSTCCASIVIDNVSMGNVQECLNLQL